MADPIRIPADELHFSFTRSSGPGGQNVNKVNSKAILHWNVLASDLLPEDARRRFLTRHRHQVNESGEIVISSQRFRDQPRNIADCIDKLQQWIAAALVRPKPRKKTKPTKASGERRLREKKSVSKRKEGRRKPFDSD